MPQQSSSGGQAKPTTASVVLKLRENRQLSPSTVSAITGSRRGQRGVASARSRSWSSTTSAVRCPALPTQTDDGNGGEQLERQQTVERDLSTRLVSLLEPIVGPGRVRVNVNAKMDTNTREETEERLGPDAGHSKPQRSSRCRQARTAVPVAPWLPRAAASGGGNVPGVAGARANLPANATAPATRRVPRLLLP